MNRYTMIYIWSLLICFCMLACEQEDSPGIMDENLMLQLRICPTEGAGRAESMGDDNLNENKLTKVDCFFYTLADRGQSNAVYSILDYPLNEISQGIVAASLGDADIEALFPDGQTACLVYMIANCPVDMSTVTQTDIAALKALEIEASFGSTGMARIQTGFVMDGQSSTIELTTESNGKKKVSGNVNLYRAASKVELVVTGVQDEITEGGVTWKSDPTKMYLRMHNGVNKSTIDASQQAYSIQTSDYFTTGYEQMTEVGDLYTSVLPYYSYATAWNADDEHEVYFTLVVPWAKVETGTDGEEIIGTYRTCYYQVPVNFNEKKLQRNTHYRLNLKVGVLGSFEDPDDPETPEVPTTVTLEPSYIIVPWSGTRIDINAQLDRPTYLVVDKNYAEMHNVSSLSIGYASSHSISSVTVDRVEYFNYQNAATRKVTITPPNNKTAVTVSNGNTVTVPDDKVVYGTFQVLVDEDNHILTFNNNTNMSTFYTTQDISLTITNEVGLSEQIKITWYPPICIIGERSTGVVFVNGQQNGSSTQYVYDNNNNNIGSTSDRDAVNGSGTNNNQNQYTVYVTALPSTSNYMIGESREESSNVTGFNNITVNGNSVPKLQGYRKSSTTSGMMIAPVFKIASSYGKTYTVTQANAERRCASYQENGYPAGRWRVPTKGEIEFVVKLSTQGVIPTLFDGEYWSSATGEYYNSNDNDFGKTNNTTTKHYVRCVYDVWYWGDGKINDLNSQHENDDSHWSVEYE